MSYLHPLRLHFAGKFQAAVSTVNNDLLHYDNSRFQPQYQDLQTDANHLNGWWNPRGDAVWRLIGCRVTAAWLADGSAAAETDPIRHCLVADSDHQVAAKLADLDPEQQLVSEIWGLEVRICDASGATLLRGQYEPAGFMDIWDRYPQGHGDALAGAMYQSVLSDLAWGDIGQSRFLQELRAEARDGLLSIKFNVDSFNGSFGDPDFTLGRIVGTIGPAAAAEPRHLVVGRQFMTTGLPSGNFFAPAGKINFCAAVVNREMGKIYLDLGNALPISLPNGPLANVGPLSVVCEVPPSLPGQLVQRQPIGEIADAVYTALEWYETTAGVVELPADRALTSTELDAIESNPLTILLPDSSGRPVVAITEPPGGVYVRADQFVFRVNPGEEATVRLYAMEFGQPYANARVISILDPTELQAGSPLAQQLNLPAPGVGTPIEAIDFPARVVTDGSGVAILPIKTSDPGNPRSYIDGQVYGVRPVLEETIFIPGATYPFNPWNFISLLVWDAFQADEPPTWYGSLQPVFQQYANLYPVMADFLDLADYDSICSNRRLLLLAFGLPDGDPNSMPASHDLSAAKRRAIVRWLSETGPDGKPRKGTRTPSVVAMEEARDEAPAAIATEPMPAQAAEHVKPPQLPIGGKRSAAGRRVGLRAGYHARQSGRKSP